VTAFEVLNALASLATAGGVGVAASQLVATRRQAVTSFEDSLASQYRSTIAHLPVEALLGDSINCVSDPALLAHFYRYFDLCNKQAFLYRQGRISDSTWNVWRDGILSNLTRPAFAAAWAEVTARAPDDFDYLRELCPPKQLEQSPK
jgi:hypothetical protein